MDRFEKIEITILGVKAQLLKGGSGPNLLYLHGASGGRGWLQHHALLAEHFTVYAPDHPGWGDSDGPEWMDSMQDYVLHYDLLIRELKIDFPLLAGHSLGGWMAAEFAIAYPDRIRALALINAAGYPFDNESVSEEFIPDFFAAASRGGPEFAKMLFHNPIIAEAYFSAQPTPEDLVKRYREMTSTARLAWHTWFEPKLPRRLSRITSPTLVLWGAHDGIFPPTFARRYAAAIPGSRLTIMEDCAHMIPIENPAAMCNSVLELYREAP